MIYIIKVLAFKTRNWIRQQVSAARVLKKFNIQIDEGQVIDDVQAIEIDQSFGMSPNCKLLARGSNAKIKIGKNVALNYNVMINADCGGEIIIKDNVIIGPNVVMRASDHIIQPGQPYRASGHDAGKIVLEENVWIGSNVFIGKNVCIGENAIVGAGSVVTKNVAANSIVVGIPAKLHKEI